MDGATAITERKAASPTPSRPNRTTDSRQLVLPRRSLRTPQSILTSAAESLFATIRRRGGGGVGRGRGRSGLDSARLEEKQRRKRETERERQRERERERRNQGGRLRPSKTQARRKEEEERGPPTHWLAAGPLSRERWLSNTGEAFSRGQK